MDVSRMAARVAGTEKMVTLSLTAEEAKALVEAAEADPRLHAKVKEAVEAVPWKSERVEGWIPPEQRK
jgi:hypothetical protein